MSRRTAPTPASRRGVPSGRMCCPRLIAFFSGTVGLASRSSCSRLERGRRLGGDVLIDRQQVGRARRARSRDGGDRLRSTSRSGRCPAQVPDPGDGLPGRFQIVPILYTINVAFTNYSTGHILSKTEAIAQIQLNSLERRRDGKTYTMAPARDADGKLVLILLGRGDRQDLRRHEDGLKPMPPRT